MTEYPGIDPLNLEMDTSPSGASGLVVEVEPYVVFDLIPDSEVVVL